MPVLPWTRVVVALISGAGPLYAQERTPVRAPVPVVVVSGSARSEFRASRDRSTPPAPLSAAEKAGIFGVALNLHAVQPQGLGKGIRLTPSQPFLANQGSLFFQAPVHVSARENGGYAEMEPPQATGYTGWHGSAVICAFRPTMVGQPLLIDVSIFFHPPGNAQKGKIRLRSSGMELDQTLELPKGSHHVLAIYKPADLAEKQIVVAVDRADGMYQRFTFYACEVTPLT